MVQPDWKDQESIEEFLDALVHKESGDVFKENATYHSTFASEYFKTTLAGLLLKSKLPSTVPQARAELVKRFNKQ